MKRENKSTYIALVALMLLLIFTLFSCTDADDEDPTVGDTSNDSNISDSGNGTESGGDNSTGGGENNEIKEPETLEEIIAYREEYHAFKFALLGSELSAEAIDVLKEIYALYDEELYIWLAELYEPAVGGFYYSNSAKEGTSFKPDLESTAQALELLETSGLASSYRNEWARMLSEETKSQILDFVRNMQSESDGYFYHPQWGRWITSNRRGRDLGWATRILRALGQKPYYDTPNGVAGLESERPLTNRLTTPTVSAVSKVVPTVAREFSSEENFRKYLDGLRINRDSYSAGHTLDSRSGEINNAGLADYLRDYLREKQCANGLWEEEISYNAINGLMKISPRFIVADPFPNADKALASVMSVINEEIESGLDSHLSQIDTICYVYNPWVAIRDVIPFLLYEEQLAFKADLIEKAPDYFKNTLDKLRLFKKEDGGFSYYQTTSAPFSQGAHVAKLGARESDVNATAIAVSTVFKHILPVFGISSDEAPALYTKYDGVYFLSVLEREDDEEHFPE